jgi:ferredoxin
VFEADLNGYDLGRIEEDRYAVYCGVTLMRIVVDLNRCLGYAQCVFLAPDVFRLHGEEALMYDPNPDDAKRLRVLRAAAACPVQAILVDRLDGTKGGAKS